MKKTIYRVTLQTRMWTVVGAKTYERRSRSVTRQTSRWWRVKWWALCVRVTNLVPPCPAPFATFTETTMRVRITQGAR